MAMDGLGVWRRDDCPAGARITGAQGWLEGTAITILEEGTGRCAGWLRARADGQTSWVDARWVREVSGTLPELPAASGVIAHTGGVGVAHRYACRDDARVMDLAGWPEGAAVAPCAGWLCVESGGVTLWVREAYLLPLR